MVQAPTDWTLRDWFAAHAPVPDTDRMATERALDRGRNPHNDSHKPAIRSDNEIKAELAYRYADCMLVARNKALRA